MSSTQMLVTPEKIVYDSIRASSKHVLSGRDCDGGDRFVGSVSEANDVPICCRDGSSHWMCHLQPHKRKAFLDSL
ncbi:hypothetical protein VNO80_27108 [Phaseolus coccineus]|uniref:Uncharacterized protein n=1 Tax=Phaseolus coccineus TaxID=3886 RepID=A0AAN9QHA1_PHACN